MAVCCTHHPPQLTVIAAKQEPYKKAYLLTKNIEEFSGKMSGQQASRQKKKGRKKKKKDGKNNRIRQKNKRGDSKLKSNDSPEIPDWGETSHIPGLPSGTTRKETASILEPSDSKDIREKDKERKRMFLATETRS